MSRPRAFLALAAVLALVVSGCGGSGPTNPDDALIDALQRTFGNSFSFDLAVEADEAAQQALAAEDPQMGAFVRTAKLSGRTTGENVAFTVHALGLDVADVVAMADESFFLRIDPGVIALASEGESSVDDLLAELGELPPEFHEPAERLLAGGWLGLDGEEARELGRTFAPLGGVTFDEDRLKTAFRTHFGGIDQFVRNDLDVTEAEDGVYDVAFRARDAARKFTAFAGDLFGEWMFPAGTDEELEADLADVPESIRGMRVTIADRMLQRVELRVFDMLRAAGADDVPEGDLSLVLNFADHGSADDVATPADVLMLDVEALMNSFMAGMGGMGEMSDLGDAGDLTHEFEDRGEEPGTRPAQPSPQAAAGMLSSAQGGLVVDGQGYTSDLKELIASDPALAALVEDGLLLGTCTYDAGEHFVVAASDGSSTMYFDSAATAMTADPVGLGCDPALS